MRLKWIAVALIASLALLASCGGDDSPSAEPSDTGIVTDTSTPPSSDPPSPTEPTKTTPSSEPKATREGAIAAAKAAVEAIDHAYATWDVEPLKKISNLASCELCNVIVRRFPQAKRDGWTIDGGRIAIKGTPRVHGFVPSRDGSVTLADVIVTFDLDALVTRKAEGSIYRAYDVLGSEPEHQGVAFRVTVRWNDPWKDKWRVEDVKRWGDW